MRYRDMGRRALRSGGVQFQNGAVITDISGFPKSGPSGTLVDSNGQAIPKGSIVIDALTGVMFTNEGTTASPYWTPVSFQQRGLLGWYTDFRDGVGIAVSDTA